MSFWNVFSLLKAQEKKVQFELTLASYRKTRHKWELKDHKKHARFLLTNGVSGQVLNLVPMSVWVPSTCGPVTRTWVALKAWEAPSHLRGLFADAVKCVKTTSSMGGSAYEMGTGWDRGSSGRPDWQKEALEAGLLLGVGGAWVWPVVAVFFANEWFLAQAMH